MTARRALPGLWLALLFSAGGCAVARSAGAEFATGAVARLQAEDTAIVALQRQLADTAFAIVAREFRSAVLDPATQTWAGMRAAARAEADTLGGTLEESLARSLENTLPQGIETNGALVQEQVRAIVAGFAEEFAAGLGVGMQTAIAPALDTLTRVVVRSTARGLEDDLRPSVHALMLEIRDSLELRIGDVDQAVSESQTVSELRFALYGAAIMLLILISVVATLGWRRRGRAVEALLDAIEAGDHGPTKQAAARCAREAGVGDWLHRRAR